MRLKKHIYNIINLICSITIFLIFFSSKKYIYNDLYIFVSLFITSVISISCCLVLRDDSKTYKTLFVIHILYTITLLFFHILKINDLLFIFSSVATFKQFIVSTSSLGVVIYILIQMAQIIILPIPASIIAIAGAIIYGPLLGSLFCTIGVLLGSYISFFIGRTLGHKIVCWAVGKDNAEKYSKILTDNGTIFLSIAFLLPMFPDDILCLIAGITSMKFSHFFTISTIFRPIGVVFMCFFGSGSVIPFSGWGIPLWIVIGIIMLCLIVLSCKYKDRIEQWSIKLVRKRKKRQL